MHKPMKAALAGLAGFGLVIFGLQASLTLAEEAPAAEKKDDAKPAKDDKGSGKDKGKDGKPEVMDFPGLHNVVWFSEGLVSGSVPHGEEGFESLEKLGVKSIICVDAAAPELDKAKKRGMRYAHLPIGYEGIEDEQAMRLTKALSELPKPIYIHCFHGKHRGPAAGACALAKMGKKTPQEAEELLKIAGTSTKYKGLYEAVRKAEKVSEETLKSYTCELPERAKTSDFASAMAVIARNTDHLKLIREAGWRVPAEHPDLDPVNEIRILAQEMHRAHDLAEKGDYPDDFHVMMDDAVKFSDQLLKLLKDRNAGKRDRDFAFISLRANCADCHDKYRNTEDGAEGKKK